MRIDCMRINFEKLAFVHPGTHHFLLHGFVFRSRQAMAAEDIGIDSNALAEALEQLAATCEICAVVTRIGKGIVQNP